MCDLPGTVVIRTINYIDKYPPPGVNLNAEYTPPDTDKKLVTGWLYARQIAERMINPRKGWEGVTC